MLINKTIPGFYNGVSQQAAELRLDTQCEMQENFMGTLTDGLYKRPPHEFVAKLASAAGSESFVHPIFRDNNEKYIVVFTTDPNNPIEVFGLDGRKYTVNYDSPSAKQYVSSLHPRDTFRTVTVSDYTIIVNRTVQTSRGTLKAPVNTPTAIIFVKKGVADTDYKVYIDNTVKASFSSTSESVTSKTQHILGHLYMGKPLSSCTSSPNLKDGLSAATWDVVYDEVKDCIKVSRKDNADFAFKVIDSWGYEALGGFKGTVQKFMDLPNLCYDDVVVEITGDAENNFDNYYVKYVTDSDKNSGVWKETIKPGLHINFNPTTMPHRMMRMEDGTFLVKAVDWTSRMVGDDTSTPYPSFIDKSISDVFFHKNRLGFLSGDSVSLSRAGDYFNFFPTTATEVLDDDPIDESVPSVQVITLDHALSFPSGLGLYSSVQQYLMHSNESPLTPKTFVVDALTSYEISPNCHPAAAGSTAYFAVPNGTHTSIKGYMVQAGRMTTEAEDVTAHVQRYLPQNIRSLVASNSQNILYAFSPDIPNELYIYKYFYRGNEQVQSAWSHWTFDEEIINITTIENLVYLLLKKDSEILLVKINLEFVNSPGLPFQVALDRLVYLPSGTYDATTRFTTWTLPYDDSNNTDYLVVNALTGSLIPNTGKQGATIKVSGKYDNIPVYIGKLYIARFRFSPWFKQSPNSNTADLKAIIKIRTIELSFKDTGYFKVEITPEARETLTHIYNATLLGVSEIGKPSLRTDTDTFLVKSRNNCRIDLVNDSYLPSVFTTATLEGFLEERSQPM